FSATTQVASSSNVIAREQDGFAPGEMVSFSIESTGKVAGTYSNGMTREIGQIALASFANPQGLVKLGSNLYTVSSNSGEARIGAAGTEGRGLIQSGALEMSNVDLAQEFTDMITTSRAFQANTRMISASDEILVELLNIKR
ncbi:MAG TPA: flagellar hook-basal body protein, partial [Firmicutes bacterium]|nr:flagellar hook-basal body protein [Bacillota bacterium]